MQFLSNTPPANLDRFNESSPLNLGNLANDLVGSLSDGTDASSGWQLSKLKQVFRRRANRRSMLIVFRQLALLVETGIDVAEALELVAESCRHPGLRESLEDILEDISSGKSLSIAVRAQEKMLGNQVSASIQAGEASGRLVDVLRQIADQLDDELKMRSTIVGAIAYPAILCSAAMVVASILIWFVLPQFDSSFKSMGVDPPIYTQYLLSISRLIRENVVVLSIGAVVGVIASVLLSMQPPVRALLGNLYFFSPVLGPALRNLVIGKLFMSMSHLLRNGISLLEAIQLLRNSTSNGTTNRLMEAWENDVMEGRGLTHSLAEFDFLPDGAGAMIIMAEKTGKLETVMATAGSHYHDEGSAQLRQILKLSEPLIIIVLGVFVGVVVASVLLPMLDVQAGAAN